MSGPDGINGIAGDRKFMDSYFLYMKHKSECEKEPKEQSELNEHYRACFTNYVYALTWLFSQIETLPDERRLNYLDWLRWNRLLIEAELDRLKDQEKNQQDTVINHFKEKIRQVHSQYFEFSETEKGISNQYYHAYESVLRREKQAQRLYHRTLQHCGRLLINYISNLQSRFYATNIDRKDISFEQLESQAKKLENDLREIDYGLSSSIKLSLQNYNDFRLFDAASCDGQDKIMEKALLLAHFRATETFTKSTIRRIRETIHRIQEIANEKMKQALEVGKIILNPILHPIETFKNIKKACDYGVLNCIIDVWEWAKEHPWKAAGIVLGGLALGALCVGLPAAGAVFIADIALTTVSLSPAVFIGIAAGGAVAAAIPFIQGVATKGNILRIEEESNKKVAIEEAKIAKLKAKSNIEANEIAHKVLYDHFRREQLRKSQEDTEKIIRQMEEERKKQNQILTEQLEKMPYEELQETESFLHNNENELEDSLRKAQSEFREEQKRLKNMNEDLEEVRKGRAALLRLSQEQANRNKPGPAQD